MDIVNVEFKGRDTIVEVAFGEGTAITRQYPPTASFRATGRARCRRADHYDEGIGVAIAASRAGQALHRMLEEYVCEQVESELGWTQRNLADALEVIRSAGKVLRELAGPMIRVGPG